MRSLIRIALLTLAAGMVPLAAAEPEPGGETPPPANMLLALLTDATATGPVMPDAHRRDQAPFALLGEQVPPGSHRRLSWTASELFQGLSVDTPVLVSHGSAPGPVLCLTAAIHGDELNGIEIVRRVVHALDPDALAGTLVGVPIVNVQGFRRGSRYMPDRRDLNRHFPGSPAGSAASRVAHAFFNDIVRSCDALVDLHTGSQERTNLPQLRADLDNAGVAALAEAFGATVIVNSRPRAGTLRHAATTVGIPTVTLEAGGPDELEQDAVSHGVRGIEALLHRLRMTADARPWREQEAVYLDSAWVRSDRGGILFSTVELGSSVQAGDLLGHVTDPITNETAAINAPHAGRVIGMARNQVVMPGFATHHLGAAARGDADPPPLEDDVNDTSE